MTISKFDARAEDIKLYANLGHKLIKATQVQSEALERQFQLELKKDIPDYTKLAQYFTKLIMTLDDVLDDYEQLTSLIIGGK
jgi:hypothetical protein